MGSILEKHYTTDKLFIIFQCRDWIERLFSEKQLALAYSSEWRNRETTEEAREGHSEG